MDIAEPRQTGLKPNPTAAAGERGDFSTLWVGEVVPAEFYSAHHSTRWSEQLLHLPSGLNFKPV